MSERMAQLAITVQHKICSLVEAMELSEFSHHQNNNNNKTEKPVRFKEENSVSETGGSLFFSFFCV